MSKTTAPRGAKAKKTSPKAVSKPGKIVVTKATASAIRESLGVTSTEAKVGASALRSVRASALKAAPKTVKQKKRTPARPTATR